MTNETPETWWGRNWKWVVPVGCLVPVVFVLLIAGAAFSLMKHSAAYTNALDTARADCAVRQALGTPIEAGWIVSGTVSVSGPSGHAELQIPLHGPRAEASLYVTATKAAGLWRFDLLQVAVAGRNERIDLLARDSTSLSACGSSVLFRGQSPARCPLCATLRAGAARASWPHQSTTPTHGLRPRGGSAMRTTYPAGARARASLGSSPRRRAS